MSTVDDLNDNALRTLVSPVRALDLSVRSNNALRGRRIFRVGDLVQLDEHQLFRTPNIGRKSWNEIVTAVRRSGLELGLSLHSWDMISEYLGERFPPTAKIDSELIDTAALQEILSGRRVPESVSEVFQDGAKSVSRDDLKNPEGPASQSWLIGLSDHAIAMLIQPLAFMALPRGAKNALRSGGVTYIGDLVQCEHASLLGWIGVPEVAVTSMSEQLARHGLEFGIELPNWDEVKECIEQDPEIDMEAAVTFVDTGQLRGALTGSCELGDVSQLLRVCEANKVEFHRDALRRESVNDDIAYLVAFASNERNRAIVREFLGWGGSERRTLEETGQLFGVTRERVRQVVAKFEKGVKAFAGRCFRIEEAIKYLERIGPLSIEKVYSRLREEEPGSEDASVTGLISAAQILGIDTELSVSRFKKTLVVGGALDFSVLKTVQSEAVRLNSARGAVNAEQLVEVAEEKFKEGLRGDGGDSSIDETVGRRANHAVECVLQDTGNFVPIDLDRRWYVRQDAPRNRLINLIEKAVAACPGSVTTSEIRQAVSRVHRLEGFRPPTSVLEGLCDRMTGIRRNGDTVVNVSLNRSDILSPLENAIYDMLARRGGFGSVVDLEKEAHESGLNMHSFYAYLSYSPIITKVSISIVALVGWEIPAGAISDLPVKRAVNRGWQWIKDGRLCFWYQLSVMTASNGVLTLPSGVAEYFQGRWTLEDDEGEAIGEVVGADSFLYGLGKHFSRLGVEPGDVVVLKRAQHGNALELTIGDEVTIDAIERSVEELPFSVKEYD